MCVCVCVCVCAMCVGLCVYDFIKDINLCYTIFIISGVVY